MTRTQVTTDRSRRRLILAASGMLVEILDGPDDVLIATADSLTERLRELGVTNALASFLTEHAYTADAIDGLTTGRYDVERYIDEHRYREETRDGLLRGFEGNLDLALDLMAVPR